ncbi:20405_t:CDS:1 [Cetraspora pellucida]|uniref:20405_t:CDS:1 n=1 Tax=Cetraspora pellucida TaxID=1433469 RepID=A0A9N9IUC1_9GLOM|nr:20405_t:CDS:1 [Cetraspora pellucida]
MSIDEFLNFPDENVIYKVSSDDKIIEELVGVFNSENANESNKTDNVDENDDSNELPIISANAALENLNNVRLFLLQQEETVEIGRQLKQTDSLENFIRKKKIRSMMQTNIDMYFH